MYAFRWKKRCFFLTSGGLLKRFYGAEGGADVPSHMPTAIKTQRRREGPGERGE